MKSSPSRKLNLAVSKADRLEIEQFPRTISGSYPANWKQYDHWMVTGEGTKKAHAANSTDEGAWSWSNPDNWTSFEKAKIAADEPQMDGEYLVFVLDRDDDEPYTSDPDPCAYVDFDNARNPDSGKIHPWVLEVIRRARSYACVSTGGSGVHIEVLGKLPSDVAQIKGEALPGHDEFPDATIEVYDGKRIDVLSGEQIAGTPATATRQDELLSALSDFFLTEDQRSENAGNHTVHDFNYDPEEIEEMDVGDMDAIKDAVEMVTPSDITLRSEKTEEQGNRHSWDPSWYSSDSGTTLGYDSGIDIWIWRDGDKKLNALDVVALEEGHISEVGETLTGKDYIDALDELRSRGANIPRLAPSKPELGEDLEKVTPDAFDLPTTKSMKVFTAAMKSVAAVDVSLSADMANVVKMVGDYHWLHEPSGEIVDTLQLVAYDEGLTDDVTDRVSGRVEWIQLGHTLRERGANVPQYTKGRRIVTGQD